MKKKTKVILCVVVVLALIASIVAAVGFNNSNNDKGKSASVNNVNKSTKNSKANGNNNDNLKSNKNVKDVKRTENGDTITVTIKGKDSASVTELKALALNTANDLKKQNPNKKVNVKAEFKNEEVEDVNLGSKADDSKIYFETKPMYDPILKCIRFKLHNLNNVNKVQVLLDGKEIKLSSNQVLKANNDVFAVKNIDQNFKTGKIILQDKSGNKLEANF
ncbi:hypothetical protein ACJDT4_01645 [Clostridium neuense]|uniref:Lipoprotein n=1 Tax=Clostridium neuense TaxID=1728934 RepID=A0ABW8TBN1_9CLOT